VIFGLIFSAGITLLAVPMLIYMVKGNPKQLDEIQDIQSEISDDETKLLLLETEANELEGNNNSIDN